jgi:hypothetical protein
LPIGQDYQTAFIIAGGKEHKERLNQTIEPLG